MRSRLAKLPLFWRVFAANATVLVSAFAGLVLAPVTVSVPVAADRARGARRRDDASARSALAWRTRRELHDEVGQTLTGVMLRVEGLAAAIPEGLREQLEVLRNRRGFRSGDASRAVCPSRRNRSSSCIGLRRR